MPKVSPLTQLPSLDEWLGRNADEIAEMIEFSKCNLQPNPAQLNEVGADVSAKSATAGYLLADVETYLVNAKAQALRDMPDDLGPTSQKVFIEDRTKDLRRLRDNLKTLVRTLRGLAIAICSIRKCAR